MTSNKLMTYGAAAFAGFALWWISRTPGNSATSAQPGQQARDAGLQLFVDGWSAQADELAKAGIGYAIPTLTLPREQTS